MNVNSPDTYRVCNTSDLRVIVSRGNGRIPQHINGLLDNGNHVLRLALFGHNMDKPNSVLHHRVKVLCKIVGTKEPHELTFDIRDDDWRRLATVDEVMG